MNAKPVRSRPSSRLCPERKKSHPSMWSINIPFRCSLVQKLVLENPSNLLLTQCDSRMYSKPSQELTIWICTRVMRRKYSDRYVSANLPIDSSLGHWMRIRGVETCWTLPWRRLRLDKICFLPRICTGSGMSQSGSWVDNRVSEKTNRVRLMARSRSFWW